MDRSALVKNIRAYRSPYVEEEGFREKFLSLLDLEPDCFFRHLAHGHITGSALVINPEGTHVLLLHHRKLDRWLQPGGHADGDEDVARVAEKEAREETGLESIQLVSPEILDLDIHTIPARDMDAEHLHYDIRFLFTADPLEPLRQNRESKGLAWLPLNEVSILTRHNSSINRMIEKTKARFNGMTDKSLVK